MADWHFAKARSWPELVAVHDRFVEDYNSQRHWAHRHRTDGRLSPREVLGWVTGLRYRPEDLERACFASRFSRVLDALGYATFRRWRLYGEEALAGREAALWLHDSSLTLEHGGRPLSRYDVERSARLRSAAAALPNAVRGGAAQAFRTRRGRLAQGAKAGRVHGPQAEAARVLAGSAVCLPGRSLGVPGRYDAGGRPPTGARGTSGPSAAFASTRRSVPTTR